jgi:O-acetylserine/cysteine efflux transporter
MRVVDVLGLLLVQLLWGAHFPISKIAFRDFSPLFLVALRFTAVAAILCPFWRFPRGKLVPILGLSLTYGSLAYGFQFAGIAHLDASTAAIVTQAQVPFAAILAAYFYSDRFGWQRLAGLALSCLGIVLVVGEPRVSSNFIWVLSILLSVLIQAFGAIQIKSLGPISSFTLTGWIAFFTAPQMLLASFLLESGQGLSLRNASWHSWAALGYTVFVVAIGTFTVWYPMLRRYSVNQVIPFTLLVPVFGVLSGVSILGESLSVQSMLGGIATIAGVAIIVLRRARVASPAAAEPQPIAAGPAVHKES